MAAREDRFPHPSDFDSHRRQRVSKAICVPSIPRARPMSTTANKKSSSTKHRPKATTVFAAAFLAGAAAAVGVNRAFDVHLAQSVPQVESEPIFVAIRSLPKGSPVTIYDVALRDWPKAMLPATALRADTNFEGVVLRHPLQEGQPILSLQLAEVRPEPEAQLATVPGEPAQPERLVKTRAAQPTPAFVPYEAASPIPLPQPAETPQATPQPVAEPTEIAATEPPKAEPTETGESESTAAKVTELADNSPAIPATVKPRVVDEPTTETTELAVTESPVVEPRKATEPEPTAAPTEPTVATATVATTAPPASMATVAAATPAGNQEASLESAPATEAVAVTVPESGEDAAEESAEPVAEPPATPSLAEAQAEPSPAAEAAEPTVAAVAEPSEAVAPVTEPAPPATAAAEPTLAVTDDQRAPVAASMEPVDVTADVLAAAAARQAENSAAANVAKTSPAESAAPLAVTQAAGQPTPTQPTAPALNETPTPASQPVMRYLVVPERIALQVDHSFTRPQPPAEPRQQTGKRGGVRPLPDAAAATNRSGGRPTPGRGRQSTEQLQASAGTIPRTANRPQQQAATNGRQRSANAQQEADQPLLRSFFPNLSAGLTAMGQEWRDFRAGNREPTPSRGRSQQQSNGGRQQRSAARPQQSR